MGIFSEHAVLRVKQRTRMTPRDILALIDSGRALDMGSKPGITKRHILFYSAADDSCYVAIQDELDGTVITVLPIDYHLNLAWNVTPEMEEVAKSLYRSDKGNQQVEEPSYKAEQPKQFYVSCRYYDAALNIKTKKLFAVPLRNYGCDAWKLIGSKGFQSTVIAKAASLGIMPSMLEDVFVRIGSNPSRELEAFVRFEELAKCPGG